MCNNNTDNNINDKLPKYALENVSRVAHLKASVCTSCLRTEAGDCSIVLLMGTLSRVSRPEL